MDSSKPERIFWKRSSSGFGPTAPALTSANLPLTPTCLRTSVSAFGSLSSKGKINGRSHREIFFLLSLSVAMMPTPSLLVVLSLTFVAPVAPYGLPSNDLTDDSADKSCDLPKLRHRRWLTI